MSKRVVYLLIPTSNHNVRLSHLLTRCVVYLLIPTSNHNSLLFLPIDFQLYIF